MAADTRGGGTRRPGIRPVLLAALVLLSAGDSAAAAAPRRPHVVLLVADDLGIADLSCYGAPAGRTPHLDRLAASGVRFADALAPASVCSPSRVALVAGVHPARAGITTFLPGRSDRASHRLLAAPIEDRLPDRFPSLAERLGPAGYRCHAVGKWHLGGAPTDRGFLTHAGGQANPGAESAEGGKGEQRQAADAAAILAREARGGSGAPLLLVVGFDSPHVPLAAPADAVARHSDAFHPTYAAMIEGLDAAVGTILAAIDAAGIADDTLVVFTSDNGGLHVPEVGDPPPTTNAPFRAGKGFLHDGGLRVPLLVRLPGFAAGGRTIDAPVSTGDLAATICALAGVAPPPEGDFQDLAGTLGAGPPTAAADRAFFWHQPHYTNQGGRPGGAVRRGRWKLLEHFEDGRLELFDVDADPGERHDLAAAEPALVAELRGLLEAWRRGVGARGMAANPRLDPARWRACHGVTDVSLLEPAPTAAEMVAGLAAWRAAMDDAEAGPPPTRRGFIRLAAADATVAGDKLRYEPQPEKDTLGYWVNEADRAWWDFRLDEPGRYRAVALVGCGAGQGGSRVELRAGPSHVDFEVEETGHFQRFVPRDLGTLDLPAGAVRLEVRALSKKAAAVMDLRQITLERAD